MSDDKTSKVVSFEDAMKKDAGGFWSLPESEQARIRRTEYGLSEAERKMKTAVGALERGGYHHTVPDSEVRTEQQF